MLVFLSMFFKIIEMKSKDIYSPLYRQDYFEGYADGLDPMKKRSAQKNTEAYGAGFASGRTDYESRNGSVLNGIPQRIVTQAILEEFLLAGLLGLSIDTENYTNFQMNVIIEWYQSGIEKYNPAESAYLQSVLEEQGIEMHSA